MSPDSLTLLTTGSRVDELVAIGAEYHGRGQIDAARLHYLAALSIDPLHPLALQNLSGALYASDKYAAAALAARMSLRVAGLPGAKGNYAIALLGGKHYAEATKLIQEVLREIPDEDSGPTWHNLGLALYMQGKITQALDAYDKALAHKVTDSQRLTMESDHALAQLALARLEEGLVEYEVRWKQLYKSPCWEVEAPEWHGELLAGKKLLLHHEQGFGDGIMLARFVPTLVDMGAEVTFAVPPELIELMRLNFEPFGVHVINWTDKDEIGARSYDYHTPMLSVLRWLNITKQSQISSAPYLKTPQGGMTIPDARFRIGVCWASGDHSAALRRRRRVIPLTAFMPLIEVLGVRVVSLQVGEAMNEIVELGLEGLIFDPMGRCADFADTAAIIDQLDIVISVDSAVAHLAGALGKKVLMLGPYTRCWRWWSETNGEPWYDNMSIFRQEQSGRWDVPMRAVTNIVRKFAGG